MKVNVKQLQELCKCGCPRSHHWGKKDEEDADFRQTWCKDAKGRVTPGCVADNFHYYEPDLSSYIDLIRKVKLGN